MIKYETERLILRNWVESDTEKYVMLNQDKEVLRFFPRIYSRAESIEDIAEFKLQLIEHGYTIYACELKENNIFIGFVGLFNRADMPFSPCVEIGWRIFKEYWGHGYAPEAALKCLDIAFNEFNISEIVAFTPKVNIPSERVMQKIGMKFNPHDEFNHYKVPDTHILSKHVLYKISLNDFRLMQKDEN